MCYLIVHDHLVASLLSYTDMPTCPPLLRCLASIVSPCCHGIGPESRSLAIKSTKKILYSQLCSELSLKIPDH